MVVRVVVMARLVLLWQRIYFAAALVAVTPSSSMSSELEVGTIDGAPCACVCERDGDAGERDMRKERKKRDTKSHN